MTKIPRDTPQFYLTAPSPCPYLAGRSERKVFTHLVGERAPELNDLLSQGGFRRSQNIAYRPACDGCRACISIRVRADEFRRSKSQKRVWNRNKDVRVELCERKPTTEQYSLFRTYLDTRHADGGMADMSVLDYAMMVEDSYVDTAVVEYRLSDGDLIGVALTDRLSDGLSMVYSFYNPEHTLRSLGTFMILEHLARSKADGLPHVYLGYWVAGSQKMDYKRNFLPQEHLGSDGWVVAD
ncbi:MAG: arginyltransferase [Pseudomonadota bacterium]